MRRRILSLTIIFVVLFVFYEVSNAEPINGKVRNVNKMNDWSIRVGLAGIYKPEYEGSDKYEVMAFPLVDVIWRDMVFLNMRDGLGIYVLNRNEFKLALSVGYTFGRNEDDSAYLAGLGDIDAGATANAIFNWSPGDLDLSARYEHQFTGEGTGSQIHLRLGYALKLSDKAILQPSVKTTYSSSEYMSAYFGISPVQAATSGLRIYETGAGVKSFGGEVMLILRLDKRWGIQTMVGYSRLVGDAADSPVVRDENQFLYFLSVSHSF